MKRLFRAIGSSIRTTVTAIVAVAIVGVVLVRAANYTMTQGAGTTFGSIVVSTVNYAQQLFCDPTTPSQCAAVSSAGAVSVVNAGTSEYPFGSTPSEDSDTGTTGTVGSALPAVASNYQFVCGISARASATAATTTTVTLTDGTWTLNFAMPIPAVANGVMGITEMIFTPCKAASATNTPIQVSSPAPGAGGINTTAIWGYYKTTTP